MFSWPQVQLMINKWNVAQGLNLALDVLRRVWGGSLLKFGLLMFMRIRSMCLEKNTKLPLISRGHWFPFLLATRFQGPADKDTINSLAAPFWVQISRWLTSLSVSLRWGWKETWGQVNPATATTFTPASALQTLTLTAWGGLSCFQQKRTCRSDKYCLATCICDSGFREKKSTGNSWIFHFPKPRKPKKTDVG